ncbi:hypothetical protein DBR06_SOUSAS12910023, partial [Sousa chinensis]
MISLKLPCDKAVLVELNLSLCSLTKRFGKIILIYDVYYLKYLTCK